MASEKDKKNTKAKKIKDDEKEMQEAKEKEDVETSDSASNEGVEKNEKDTEDVSEGNEDDREETKENLDEEATDEPVSQPTVYADDFSAVTVENRFSFKRLFLFITVVIVSSGVFFAGLLYYYSNNQLPQLPEFNFLSRFTTQSAPTPTETPSPTLTPEPEVALSDYAVQVLNGSGVSGVAGSVSELLEDEGFESVEVGNADEQNYEDTEVQMKEEVPNEVFETLVEVLDTYTVVEGDTLDEDSDFDIVITVGQQIEEEE